MSLAHCMRPELCAATPGFWPLHATLWVKPRSVRRRLRSQNARRSGGGSRGAGAVLAWVLAASSCPARPGHTISVASRMSCFYVHFVPKSVGRVSSKTRFRISYPSFSDSTLENSDSLATEHIVYCLYTSTL